MRLRGTEDEAVAPEYRIEIKNRLPLGATPVDVKSLSFASLRQTIASVLAENHSVLLFDTNSAAPTKSISVGDEPIEISGGGGDQAYVACRASKSVDVITPAGLVKRIDLPGHPYSLAWNGSYNPSKQRVMVTCQKPDSLDGIVVVIEEETLQIVNVLDVGKQPRGICLDRQRKQMLVANYGSDSISIIDQSGKRTLATLPTAGRPWAINASWFDPQDIMVSLRGGGILQRLDASVFPPVLSGLTALVTPNRPPSGITPYSCLSLNEDHLWLVPDSHSEALALVKSEKRDLKQIGYHRIGPVDERGKGLGRIAISGHGLSSTLYIANRQRKELILAKISRQKSRPAQRRTPTRETL